MMPKIKLNKYLKVGLVLSLIWVIVVFFNVRNGQIESANHQGNFYFGFCSDLALKDTAKLSKCEAKRAATVSLNSNGATENAAAAALLPVPFLWLVAFILFHIGRGIKIGFKAVVPWSTFNLRKKIVAGFCLFVIWCVGYGGLMAYLNNLADRRVPVALTSGDKPSSLPIWEGNSVYFTGTWTRHGLSEGSGMGNPINLSSFQCYKETMTCIEGQAQVLGDDSTHTLSADVNTHQLDTWTDSEITYKDVDFCATTNYTIDLKSGAVNGVGHLTNIGKAGCMPEGLLDAETAKRWPDTSWTMTLTYDGFSVYWAERKKAMPSLAKALMPWARL